MQHTNRTIAGLIAIIALAWLAVPAGATVTVQNTSADWQALTTGYFTTLVDFDGLVKSTSYSTADGVTLSGIKFVGDNLDGTYLLAAHDSTEGPSYNWNSGAYLLGSGWGTKYIQATLPAGITALGVDLMSNPSAHSVTVALSTGESYTVNTSANPNRTFFGLVSDTPLDWVRFSAAGSFTVIDNFTTAFVDTPEPDAFFLAGAGLMGLWFARRLRRRCSDRLPR
jgi:hypothetical protein